MEKNLHTDSFPGFQMILKFGSIYKHLKITSFIVLLSIMVFTIPKQSKSKFFQNDIKL